MDAGIDVVVIAVLIVSVIIAVLILARSAGVYDHLGSGGFEPPPDDQSARGGAVRDEDIRQMLEARNTRRAARGEATVDVEEELRRLTAEPQPADPELIAEVRQLVEARNTRRMARGEAPLDVEVETARRLKELGA